MKRLKTTTGISEGLQSGFTIVELLIATTVFSLVLIVLLYGVLSFTHAYYSGVNSSSTQDTARTIVNTVAQAVEFSGNVIYPNAQVSGNKYYFCAGGNTYYYILGNMYDGAPPSSTDPGLFMDPGICRRHLLRSPNTGAKELLNANMRITYLTLVQSPSNPRLYTVSLGLAYGYGDLLCNNSKTGTGSTGGCLSSEGDYSQSASVIGTNANDVVCKQQMDRNFAPTQV